MAPNNTLGRRTLHYGTKHYTMEPNIKFCGQALRHININRSAAVARKFMVHCSLTRPDLLYILWGLTPHLDPWYHQMCQPSRQTGFEPHFTKAQQNPAYSRNWISWHLQTLVPIPENQKLFGKQKIKKVSDVTCHLSPVMCHLSAVTRQQCPFWNLG